MEYLAVLAVAVVLILAVVIALWGAQVGSMVARAICTITQQTVCRVDAGLSPYERALTGRYVALGDSFSSGEGAWDYEEGTDFDDRDDPWPFNDGDEAHNRCHRSANAYSQILASNNTFAGGNDFNACSGSRISDFNNPNHKETGEDPQVMALDDDTTLVTLSVGGNDLEFTQVMTDCVTRNLKLGSTDCRRQHGQRIAARLPEIRADLVKLYAQIRREAPNARIIVVGYPPLFPERPAPNYRNLLRAPDQVWMNGVAAELNAAIASAAQETGVEFVDPTAAFRDHGLGTDDSWFNDLRLKGPGMLPINPSSFHPNANGQAAYAALIQRQLEDPR